MYSIHTVQIVRTLWVLYISIKNYGKYDAKNLHKEDKRNHFLREFVPNRFFKKSRLVINRMKMLHKLKGTVQQDGSGLNKVHSIGRHYRVKHGGFKKNRSVPHPVRAL